MKILLDTHVLVWWMFDAKELTKHFREHIANPANLIFVSAATVWELRIKSALGKINLPNDFVSILETEKFENLSVTWRHADAVKSLPMHHHDPFDRMLIAQAQMESLALMSHDAMIAKYDVAVIA